MTELGPLFLHGHLIDFNYTRYFDLYCIGCTEIVWPFLKSYRILHQFQWTDKGTLRSPSKKWWTLHKKCFQNIILPSCVVKDKELYHSKHNTFLECLFCSSRIKAKTNYYKLRCYSVHPHYFYHNTYVEYENVASIYVYAHQHCYLWRNFRHDIDNNRKLLWSDTIKIVKEKDNATNTKK